MNNVDVIMDSDMEYCIDNENEYRWLLCHNSISENAIGWCTHRTIELLYLSCQHFNAL